MRAIRSAVIRMVARLVVGAGLMPRLLSLSDRWRWNRGRDGALRFPWLARRQEPPYQILTYHRVGESSNPILGALATEAFRGQMEVLARHFRVVPLEDLAGAAGRAPRGALAITFDDGYRDNYRVALPILRSFSFAATVFLTTGTIGTDRRLWHDELAEALSHSTRDRLEWGGAGYSLADTPARVAAFYGVRGRLLEMSGEEARLEMARVLEALGVIPAARSERIMLSWDEVRAMTADGVRFGSHTVTHPILSRLSREEIVREIRASRDAIERELGRPVRFFAYPNGRAEDFNEVVQSVLHTEGFEGAVTTIAGTNDSTRDRFALRRQTPAALDAPTFALQLAWYRFQGD